MMGEPSLRGWAEWIALVVAATLPCAVASADDGADGFPSQAITTVVTFPPGGGTDLLARTVGPHLQRILGQPVVIENRPGASGNIGASRVAHAAGDGHTLLMANSSFAINPGVYPSMDFAPKQDFTAVVNMAVVPSLIVVGAKSPWRRLAEILGAPHAGGQPVPYASCGNGTPQHLAGELLAASAGQALQQIPYRGCGPALIDVVSGQVPVGVVTASSAAPLIRAGRLRALAVTAATRSPMFPDVPTIAESGVPGFDLTQWHGLLAPASTPPGIVAKIHHAVTQTLRIESVRKELQGQGFELVETSSAAFQRVVHRDIDRFSVLAERIGLRAD